MKTSNLVLSALLAFTTSSAFALDLITNVYPTSYLGPIANAKAVAAGGTVMCELATEIDTTPPTKVTGHMLVTLDGIQDSKGFGHFTSPSGKPSFLHYTYTNPNIDPITGTNIAVSCVQALDLKTSKYAMNVFGVGVSEMHWLADTSNATTAANCGAMIDQVGWVSDKNGNSFSTKFLDPIVTNPVTSYPKTTTRGIQSVSCMRTGL